ncbi:hypothetical protein SAMN05421776_105347 [Nocardia farcinica]|uniref:Uncharacterized protein n=1 Tax=Nocardia farcinica TaxID=37329 RepID=A0A0H5NUI6_NOCFR|nr:hypothetical protein [Nocardia farcinica]PFX04008.1 hypothetical protein CJ469_01882 [Nocardia farcinica]PFX10166.1 hypothetical protein CJ468_01013 [Nocardia farcinica]CRY73681.1 Uncharacterised protein [Nocardia farcinica]SIT24804.1 hypothetical protein SAMN05421776_105347 [Nocardia farcinica]
MAWWDKYQECTDRGAYPRTHEVGCNCKYCSADFSDRLAWTGARSRLLLEEVRAS